MHDDYQDELEYVEVESTREGIKNKKQLYLDNDYPDEDEYELSEDNQIDEEKGIDFKQNRESRANLASKRPIQRAKEPFDIKPLEENNVVVDNKKLDKIEIDDPW